MNFRALSPTSRAVGFARGFPKCQGINASRSGPQPETKGRSGYKEIPHAPTSWWANFERVFYTVSQNFSMEPSPSHPQQVTCLMTCLVLAAFPPFPLPYRCFLGSLSDEPPHWHPGLRVCLGKLKPRHHSGFCKPGLEQTKVEAGRQVQIGKDSGLDQVAAEAFWALDFPECEGLLGAEPAE